VRESATLGELAAYADFVFQNRLVDFKGLVVVPLFLVDHGHVSRV
jgi:hypothetical protein